MASTPFERYKAGIHSVGNYQVSGLPWITGSTTLDKSQEHGYKFPLVTKNITVINGSSEDIRVHFNSTSSTTAFKSEADSDVITGLHYVTLNSAEDSYTFNIKCKEIYISAPSGNSSAASYTIIAELTTIAIPTNFELTGSGLTTLDGT